MKYEEYKDSGVEWIGEIPSHWEVCAFKRKITINNGKDYKDFLDNEIYPVMGSGGCFAYCSKFMYDGEALLMGRKGTIDKPLYIKGKFWVVDTMFYAVPTKDLYCKFAYYLALTFPYSLYSTSTALPSMTQTDIGNNPVAFPLFSEQRAIAAYLDKKCEEINRAIDVQKKKIDLLNELNQTIITNAVTKGLNPNAPMKDSGVEWIGEVPKHWEVMKLNFACKKITDFVASGSFADLRNNVTYLDEPDYAMLVRTADLSGKDKATAKVYVSKHSYKFLSNSNLFGGEVILPNIGASIGDVYIVPEHIYEKATLGPNSIMLISKTDNNFLYYLFRSKRWREALIILGQAAAQSKFNKTEVRGLKVIIPPITEQQTIVAHIEKKVSKIDLQISKANRRIELLEELKQSIITEAVTGKIKVC